jgi:hypothetical protein
MLDDNSLILQPSVTRLILTFLQIPGIQGRFHAVHNAASKKEKNRQRHEQGRIALGIGIFVSTNMGNMVGLMGLEWD